MIDPALAGTVDAHNSPDSSFHTPEPIYVTTTVPLLSSAFCFVLSVCRSVFCVFSDLTDVLSVDSTDCVGAFAGSTLANF